MNKKTKEFREAMTEKFLKSLEENPMHWRKEWTSPLLQQNAISHKPYKGINRLMLNYVAKMKGYEDCRWCTFKQLKDNDWKLKRGSKGITVEYWMPYDKKLKAVIPWTNVKNLLYNDNINLIPKYYTVFNVSDMIGVPQMINRINSNVKCDSLIKDLACGFDIEIAHDDNDRAFYNVATDKIHLPKPEYFDTQYAYSSTAAHELAHSSGHSSRLNRPSLYDNNQYAYEELVAEISSCFIANLFPLENDENHLKNHTAYVQEWCESIKKDPDVLLKATKDAEKVSAYMEEKLGIINERELEIKNETNLTLSEESDLLNPKNDVNKLAPKKEKNLVL